MKKVVIRIPNHLGDTLMAQPAVAAFLEKAPEYSVSLLLPRWAEPIYDDLGRLSMLALEKDRLHGFSGILAQSRRLKAENMDLGILLTPSFSSALAFYLGGVGRRLGYEGNGRRRLLTDPVGRRPVGSSHRFEQYLDLIRQTLGRSVESRRPVLKPSAENGAKAVALLKKEGLESGRPFVVIAPQAVAASRRWGLVNYHALARRLSDHFKLAVVLVGTADEYPAGEAIRGTSDNIINLCGETDITTAAAIMARGKLFVGNDSGLAHLAAAVDIPLVVLSGADNPAETSPLSGRKKVIYKDYLECISCVKNVCPLRGGAFMRCMKEISIDEVFAAAAELLSE